MLKIYVPDSELFNDITQEFVSVKGQYLMLEHSLLSISKWEAKWHKPFLVQSPKKTSEETLYYIKCMTLNSNVDENIYKALTAENIKAVEEYIEDPMTGTTFTETKMKGHSKEIVTSELIYYWMVALEIPFECQKWHLNRLLTLIRVCNVKNAPPKKMSRSEIYSRNRALNEARRRSLHTKG